MNIGQSITKRKCRYKCRYSY